MIYQRFSRLSIVVCFLFSNSIYAEMQSVEINGHIIEYSVPDTSKIQAPKNTKMSLKVLIADPTLLPENYLPIRAKPLSMTEIYS